MLTAPSRILGNLWRLITSLLAHVWFALVKHMRRHTRVYLELELEPSYPLGSSSSRLQRWFGQPSTSLLELRQTFQQIAQAQEVEGVIIRLDHLDMGFARTAQLASWMLDLQKANKRIILHTDSASSRDLPLLASASDRLLTPAGRLYLFGARFEEIFAADLLNSLGVHAQFVHIGAFKTATHRFHKSQMTSPQRLMMQSLQQGLDLAIQQRLSQHMLLPQDALSLAIQDAPLDAPLARHHKLISDTAFASDLQTWLTHNLSPTHDPPPHPTAPRRLAQSLESLQSKDSPQSPPPPPKKDSQERLPEIYHAQDFLDAIPKPWRWRPILRRKRYIAAMDLSGPIFIDSEGGVMGRGASIKSVEVIPTLQQLAKDPRCVGLLLHVNSPGGSALASDLIWFELQKLRQEKPVVCYCSDVAASGGYYIACGADRIICNPETITGSIGVITGKIALQDTLAKFNIHVDAVESHPNSRFNSAFAPLPQDAFERLVRDTRSFYARFLDRVGEARGLERRRLHRYARGRVYLGDDALQRKLVDSLGGLDDAINTLYQLCNTSPEETPISFAAHHKESLGELARGSLISAQHSLNPLTQSHTWRSLWQDPAAMLAWLEREPTLAIMPWRIS